MVVHGMCTICSAREHEVRDDSSTFQERHLWSVADRRTRQQSRADNTDYCFCWYIYFNREEKGELKFLSTRMSSPTKVVRRCSRCRAADSALIELAAQQRATPRECLVALMMASVRSPWIFSSHFPLLSCVLLRTALALFWPLLLVEISRCWG